MMATNCTININELADGEAVRIELRSAFFEKYENSDAAGGNVTAAVMLRKIGGDAILHIAISGSVRVVCDRCLEEFDCAVNYEERAMVRNRETHGSDDDAIVADSSGNADLAQYLYESVCLSLPLQKLHPIDNEGNSGCNPQMLAKLQAMNCNL